MKLAVFKYDTTPNLGDEMQSIAAMRLVPRVDHYIEREGMHRFQADEPVFLVANGWYLHNRAAFPPASIIRPFYVSIHLTSEKLMSPASVVHLKEHEPIGCRDPFTFNLMRRYRIDAYLSGCLTMTLEAEGADERNDAIYIVDVSESVLRKIPEELRRRAVRMTHVPAEKQREKKFAQAEQLINLYASARLVITGRLHAALPCLALKTPVVFLHPDRQDRRFGAIAPFLNIHDANSMDINWQPEPPDVMTHACHLRTLCKNVIDARNNPLRLNPNVQALISRLQEPWL